MGAVKNVAADCPDCGGEGYHITLVGPGREYMYGFIPREEITECPACGGTGYRLSQNPDEGDDTVFAPRPRVAVVEDDDLPEADLPF